MRHVAGGLANTEAAKAHATETITDLLGECFRRVRIEWPTGGDR